MTDDGDVLLLEDFSRGELDRRIWNVRETGRVVNDEQQAYVDDPQTVYVEPRDDAESGGACLVIHPRHRPGFRTADGQRFDFVSGRIDTRDRFAFRYGTVSARIRLPAGSGIWPAFWMMGDGPWPEIGEIDVMECVGDPGWISSGVHGPGYAGEGGLVNRRFFEGDTDATGWHVYSLEWSPDELAFRVDGRLVHHVTRPMTEFFGRWAFDGEKFLILNVALGGTYPFKTNGLRSPYHGLSWEALDAIETGRARMLVDWVRAVTES